MVKKILLTKGLLAFMAVLLWPTDVSAWDTGPDPMTGKYDKYFDRPTHFPNFEESRDWPNNMSYYVAVRLGKSGNRLENYEVAVYDQYDVLRACSRSYDKDGDLCSLSIWGTDGDTFRFEIIYGDDFENPTIERIPELTVPFKTNFSTGNKSHPYWLTLPAPTILDETSVTAPEAETNANVRVLRTINANEWGTICLPFAMSEEQVKAAFGENVKLGDYVGNDVTYEDDDETIVQSIKVKFNTVNEMEANHPYIIKVASKITQFEIEGVDIVALGDNEDPSVDRDEYRTGSGTRKDPYVYHYNSFIGNYENGFLVPDLCLFLSGGKFWYSVGSTPMMGFRGYFDFLDYLPEADTSSARIGISIIDEVVGIASTEQEPCLPSAIYTLDGRKVSEQSMSHHTQLKKGIYIIGGKKYVIK